MAIFSHSLRHYRRQPALPTFRHSSISAFPTSMAICADIRNEKRTPPGASKSRTGSPRSVCATAQRVTGSMADCTGVPSRYRPEEMTCATPASAEASGPISRNSKSSDLPSVNSSRQPFPNFNALLKRIANSPRVGQAYYPPISTAAWAPKGTDFGSKAGAGAQVRTADLSNRNPRPAPSPARSNAPLRHELIASDARTTMCSQYNFVAKSIINNTVT